MHTAESGGWVRAAQHSSTRCAALLNAGPLPIAACIPCAPLPIPPARLLPVTTWMPRSWLAHTHSPLHPAGLDARRGRGGGEAHQSRQPFGWVTGRIKHAGGGGGSPCKAAGTSALHPMLRTTSACLLPTSSRASSLCAGDQLAAFQREAVLLSRLHHRNIVQARLLCGARLCCGFSAPPAQTSPARCLLTASPPCICPPVLPSPAVLRRLLGARQLHAGH